MVEVYVDTFIYCPKFNEIDLGNSGIQLHVSWSKWCKQLKNFIYRLIKKCPIHYGQQGKFLKGILAYLYCSKCNEIFIGHSDVKKHLSYTLSYKIFLISYEPCLENTGMVFSNVFHVLLLLYKIIMDFVMHIKLKDIIQCSSKVIKYLAFY